MSNEQQNARSGVVWTILFAVVAVALVAAVAYGCVTIRGLKTDLAQANNDLNHTIVSLTDTGSKLEQTRSELAVKDQAVVSYQAKVKEQDKKLKSYASQVSELKKKLKPAKPAVPTASQTKTPAKSHYAVSAVTAKTVYLTFDDGPSANTLEILKILKKYNIKATFFVVGTSKLSYVKQVHDEGHTVGLHSYTHDYSKIYRSVDGYFADLTKLGKKVKELTGEDSKVIRFPGGTSNTVSRSYCRGIMTALSKEVLNRGYVYFDWNVDSEDATGNTVPVSKIVRSIKNTGACHKQEVVLMHDLGTKTTTVKALPQIIEFYISKGYSFAPLTVNTPPVTHHVNN